MNEHIPQNHLGSDAVSPDGAAAPIPPQAQSPTIQNPSSPLSVFPNNTSPASNHSKSKKAIAVMLIIALLFLTAAGGLVVYFALNSQPTTLVNNEITTYEACVVDANSIIEAITNTCITADGQAFKQAPTEDHLTTIPDTTGWQNFTNGEFGISLLYPPTWSENKDEESTHILALTTDNDFDLTLDVWRVTGFGYCYRFEDPQTTTMNGIKITTQDGIGGEPSCDPAIAPSMGVTSALIPLEENNTLEPLQLHLMLYYPVSEKAAAKASLDSILATLEIKPSPTEGQTCANYTYNGEIIQHCATCGDRICEPIEGCISSNCGDNQACTSDCGPLYCPDDCF